GERSSGAEARSKLRAAEINSEGGLAHRKKRCSDESADPDVSPGNRAVRKQLVEEREEKHEHDERKRFVQEKGRRLEEKDAVPEVAGEAGQRGAHEERNHEEETGAKDYCKGCYARFQEPRPAALPRGRNIPDCIQCILHLKEYAGGAEKNQ